jgi:hypothetical protein
MNYVRSVGSVAILTGLVGCVMSAGPVHEATSGQMGASARSVTLLSDGPYNERLAEELVRQGFAVRPTPTPGVLPQTKYGVRFNIQVGQTVCVFTPNVVGDATLTVVDLRNSDVIKTFRQRGATGNCSSVDPVYPALVRSLSASWVDAK